MGLEVGAVEPKGDHKVVVNWVEMKELENVEGGVGAPSIVELQTEVQRFWQTVETLVGVMANQGRIG